MKTKAFKKTLSVFLSLLMVLGMFTILGAVAFAAADGVPTRDDINTWFTDPTLYGAEKWDKTTGRGTLTFNWNAYSGSIGYDPQPGKLIFTYPSHMYLNVGETLEAAGYMGHMTASYGENDGSDVTDFRVMLSSATWGESTRAGFSPISELISNYGHQGTLTDGSKLMTGSSSHYDFSNDGRGSDQIIGNKSGDNENFLSANESVVVWRSNIQWTGSDMNNFDEYVLLTGTAAKTGEVTFNPTAAQNFTIGAAQRYTAFAWHSDNGTRFNRYRMSGGSRPQTTPAEDALSITVTVYDKSQLSRLISAADAGTLSADADALAAARAVLADREVTQVQIDAAANSIGDRMTLLINDNVGKYTFGGDAFGTAMNTFDAKAYHWGDEAIGGYQNIVYAPQWSTVFWGVDANNYIGVGRLLFKLASPANVVMVYDGVPGHEPYAPIEMETTPGDEGGSAYQIVWSYKTDKSLYNVGNSLWKGSISAASNPSNATHVDDAWQIWAGKYEPTDDFDADTYNNNRSSDSLRDTNGPRFWWNTIKYVRSEENTVSYYDVETDPTFYIQTKYHSGTSNPTKEGYLTAKSVYYTINYKPVYDRIGTLTDTKYDDAVDVKEILDNTDEVWKYTEESVNRAKATLAVMERANPKYYSYADVAGDVETCANYIADAVYMLDHDGLKLEKKQGTVTFVRQNGKTVVLTETKNYGETVTVPVATNTEYLRTDTAQWDYTEDASELSWDPVVTAGSAVLVDEPEKIYQLRDKQTVQTYTVTFYDEDNETVLNVKQYDEATDSYVTVPASKAWQYGDYPNWGSDEAPAKQDYDYNYAFDHWTKYDGTGSYELNDNLQPFTVEDVDSSTRAALDTDLMTKYLVVWEKTDRTDADYTDYNAALEAAEAVLDLPGLTARDGAVIRTAIDAEIARAHDEQNRNYRSDDNEGVQKIATAVTNLEAIVAQYTNSDGELKDDYKETYTVVFWNANEKIVDTTVHYGDPLPTPAETPTYADGTDVVYAFAGWADSFGSIEDVILPETVTANLEFFALYDGTVSVTWKNGDETIAEGRVEVGSKPAYGGDMPTTADAQYTYTAIGWNTDPDATTALETLPTAETSNLVLYAIYDKNDEEHREENYYTVTTSAGAHTTLSFTADAEPVDGKYAYGTVLTITAAADEAYSLQPVTVKVNGEVITGTTYTVTGDTEITTDAIAEESINKYTIKFVNEEGTEISSAEYVHGAAVTVPTAPEKKTAQYTYTFLGWDNGTEVLSAENIPAATAEVTYTAKFDNDHPTTNKYTVIWANEDGTPISTEPYDYGTTPTFKGTNPTKEATVSTVYTFAGWNPEITAVTGDATYTATFTESARKYTITWNYATTSGEDSVATEAAYGTPPVAPEEATGSYETADYIFNFDGWTPEITEVTGPATYTARYDRHDKDDADYAAYTAARVQVVELQVQIEDAGLRDEIDLVLDYADDLSSYLDPFKADYVDPDTGKTAAQLIEEARQALLGLLAEIADDDGEGHYTLKEFTITWVNEGELIGTTTVKFGSTPAHDPVTTSDAQYTYTSIGWDPEIEEATEDATYTAVYDKNDETHRVTNKYTITWVDAGEPATTEVEYGVTPTHTLPVKNDDTLYTYTYDWDREIVPAHEDATYTAVESRTYNDHVIDVIEEAEEIVGSDDFEDGYKEDVQEQLDVLDDTKEPVATDEQKEAALEALEDLLDEKEDHREDLDEYADYDDVLGQIEDLLADEGIDPVVKAAVEEQLADIADTVVDENDERFTKPGTDEEKQAVTDATDALRNILNDLDKDHDGQLDDDKRADLDEYGPYDEVLEKVNELLNDPDIDPEVKAAIENQLKEIADTVVDDNDERFKKPGTDEEKQAVTDATAALNDIIASLDADNDGELDEAKKAYTVTFVNGATGETIKSEKLKVGEIPSCELPVKEDDELYTYTYAWDKDFVAVTGDATYTAQYDKDYKQSVKDLIDEAEDVVAHDETYDEDYLDDIQNDLDVLNNPDATDDEKKAAVEDLEQKLTEEEKEANTLHTLTVVYGNGAADKTLKGKTGAEVTIDDAYPTRDGWAFTGWTADKGTVSGKTYTFADADATVTAGWYDLTEVNTEKDKAEDLLDDEDLDDEYKEEIREILDEIEEILDNPPVDEDALEDLIDELKYKTSEEEQAKNTLHTLTVMVNGEIRETVRRKAGETYILQPAAAPARYTFTGWTADKGTVTGATYTFTNEDATVTAVFALDTSAIDALTDKAEDILTEGDDVYEEAYLDELQEKLDELNEAIGNGADEETVKTLLDELEALLNAAENNKHVWGPWEVLEPADFGVTGTQIRYCQKEGCTLFQTRSYEISAVRDREIQFTHTKGTYYIAHFGTTDYYSYTDGKAIKWYSGATFSFDVVVTSDFHYQDYVVYVNGRILEGDNGHYVIPAGSDRVVITVVGVVDVPEDATPSGGGSSASGPCKYCGANHGNTIWGRIVAFIHAILYFFKNLFR